MSEQYVPRGYALVSGVGYHHSEDLVAIDRAMQAAGTHRQNHVKVTSVLPPQAHCRELSKDELKAMLKPAAITPAAIGMCTAEFGFTAVAGVAVGVPKDPTQAGVIMELHEVLGLVPKDLAEDQARSRLHVMVAAAMEDRKLEVERVQIAVAVAEPGHSTRHGAAFAAVILI